MFRIITTNTSNQDNIFKIQGARVLEDKNDIAGIIFQNHSSNEYLDLSSIVIQNSVNSSNIKDGDLVFKTSNSNVLIERARFNNLGYYGLNTPVPSELLTVNGNTYITNKAFIDNSLNTPKINFYENYNQAKSDNGSSLQTFFYKQDNYNLSNGSTDFLEKIQLDVDLYPGTFEIHIEFELINISTQTIFTEIESRIDSYIWFNCIEKNEVFDQQTKSTKPYVSASFILDLSSNQRKKISINFKPLILNTISTIGKSIIKVTKKF